MAAAAVNKKDREGGEPDRAPIQGLAARVSPGM